MPIPTLTGSIYSLSDPRDGVIRYIGQTTQPLPRRREQHIENPTNPAMGVWIGILTSQGLEPVIRQVARVSRGDLDRVEKEQIELHGGRNGHPLLNKEFKSRYLKALLRDARNLADTSTADTVSDEPKPPTDKTDPVSLTPESARWLRRRAERHIRLPESRNRFGVFLCNVAWLLMVWLLLLAVFCFRATRMIFGASKALRRGAVLVPMLFCVRTDPGLRAFTHDYVTSYLPIARTEVIWHKYFEHFAIGGIKDLGATIAISASMYFLALAGMYSEQIEAARAARERKVEAKRKPQAVPAALSVSGNNSSTAQMARALDTALLVGVRASPAVESSPSTSPAPS